MILSGKQRDVPTAMNKDLPPAQKPASPFGNYSAPPPGSAPTTQALEDGIDYATVEAKLNQFLR